MRVRRSEVLDTWLVCVYVAFFWVVGFGIWGGWWALD